MRKNVLIIGAGGVGKVVAHKGVQYEDELGRIAIASRNLGKCHAIIDSVRGKDKSGQTTSLCAYELNALDIEATKSLIHRTGSRIVINVGAPFINQAVLQACMETEAAYIDTAIHESPDKVCETPPWYANYEWKHANECKERGITAILGAGFDPGVVNAWASLARKRWFDLIDSIDILDVNAGQHGKYFSTNFDPETNLREFTGQVWSWQNAQWTRNCMFEVKQAFTLPVVGQQDMYLTGHDELHSLSKYLDVPNIRFWMSFGEHYINVFTVLKNIGLLSEKAVEMDDGRSVIPLKVVKALLPDPGSLAPGYVGKTCIGDLVKGSRKGTPAELLIYNVADHTETFAETDSQAIAYTAGVPPVAAARLIANGIWDVRRMVNVEELPPEPFLKLLDVMGLPTQIRDARGDRPWDQFE